MRSVTWRSSCARDPAGRSVFSLSFTSKVTVSRSEMEEKLIEAVRIREVLYDTNHVDYMKPKLKAKKWEELAKELNMKSGAEAKALWEKLRHSLRDAIRRKQKSFKSGIPAHAIKDWKFEKQMGFLRPFMFNKSWEGILREDDDHENLSQNSEANITSAEVDIDVVEEVEMHEQSESAESATSAATSSSASKIPKSAKKFKKDDMTALLKQKRKKSLDGKRKFEGFKPTQNDPLFHFFISMYQTTKRMPPESQHIVKTRVFNAVTDVEATLLNIPL